jgi:hypothetical protein
VLSIIGSIALFPSVSHKLYTKLFGIGWGYFSDINPEQTAGAQKKLFPDTEIFKDMPQDFVG